MSASQSTSSVFGPKYQSLKDIPTDELATRVVGALIMANGNLNRYEATLAYVFRELRGEPHPFPESASEQTKGE